jgi:hypothetical protein
VFIEALKRVADKDDRNQIFLSDFVAVCKQFKIDLTESERTNLLFSFPGRAEGARERINIYQIFNQKYNLMNKKMYEQVNMHEPDKKEDAIDASGYTGIFHRTKKVLKPITEREFI